MLGHVMPIFMSLIASDEQARDRVLTFLGLPVFVVYITIPKVHFQI